MPRYVPRQGNGKVVPLSLPLTLLRYNHLVWPMEPDSGVWSLRLDLLVSLVGFVVFLQHHDAELRYLASQWQNIDKLLTGIPTYVVLFEAHLRLIYVRWSQKRIYRTMKHFYSHIYVDRQSEPMLFDQIERQMRPCRVTAYLYLGAVFGFFSIPILCIIYQRKELLFAMIYPFDFKPMWIYIPLLFSNIWVALVIDVLIFGETNLMGEMMMHLKARYLMLNRHIQLASKQILKARDRQNMAEQMRHVLTKALRRNVELHNFSNLLEEQYNADVFLIFSFAALLLCALSFKTYTNPMANYTYGIWFTSKTVELMAFGQLGSKLAYTTDKLSSMYYECNWEQIIYYSRNTVENIRLMKLVVIAIEVNAKPFYITGLKYFQVSILTVIKILQGAFSYFTFLTSMR